MKYIFIFLFANLFCINSSAQSDTDVKIDTTAIVFKAKLFTVSQHKSEKESSLIDHIEALKYKLYTLDDFLFIKVHSRYYCWDNTKTVTSNWCDCDYYVCYSKKKDVYYLIGGFKIDNINEFAKEFEYVFKKLTYDIEDKILETFIKNILEGKIIKARQVFEKCIEKF